MTYPCNCPLPYWSHRLLTPDLIQAAHQQQARHAAAHNPAATPGERQRKWRTRRRLHLYALRGIA